MEDNNYKPVTLSTLMNGALEERFQLENKKVLASIYDPNTKKGKVEITCKITYEPKYDTNGKLLYFETFVSAHGTPLKYGSVKGSTHTYKKNGEIVHIEQTRTLGELFQEQADKDAVKNIKEVANNA
jgi:hypothetical protein